uniref:Uncharacterized protein n=1 Tax=Trichogramma kaykai TaxID=54128 RepID=A0ABD2WKP1_9HYME
MHHERGKDTATNVYSAYSPLVSLLSKLQRALYKDYHRLYATTTLRFDSINIYRYPLSIQKQARAFYVFALPHGIPTQRGYMLVTEGNDDFYENRPHILQAVNNPINVLSIRVFTFWDIRSNFGEIEESVVV